MSLRFSVIVPVYRQWHLVPRLLESLSRQSVGRDQFEVLLVNNQPDFTGPFPALPANTRILQCSAVGSYAARNAGVAEARGEWFAFTDADCMPAADWLERMEAAIAAYGDDTLLAGAIPVVALNPSPFEVYDAVRGINQQRYVSKGYGATANLVVRAAVLRAVGGFDQRRLSGGDGDFCLRAGAMGYPIRYIADAVVTHPARTSWEELSSKSRRLQGGRLSFGSALWRTAWVARSLIPPRRMIVKILAAREYSWRLRLGAMGIAIALWATDLVEVVRLGLGGQPERR